MSPTGFVTAVLQHLPVDRSSVIAIILSPSTNGIGRQYTEYTKLKIAVSVAIPTASVVTTTTANPGALRNDRSANRTSPQS